MLKFTALSLGHQLRALADDLADATVALEYSGTPVGQRRSAATRRDARDEAASHVCHLADAVDADSQLLFDDYIKWVNVRLRQDLRHSEGLDHQLACLAAVLRQRMPPRVAAAAVPRLEEARALLPIMPAAADTAIDPDDRFAPLAREFDATHNGEPLQHLYMRVLQPALHEVGRLWEMRKITVAQEHFCSLSAECLMSRLVPPHPPVEQRETRAVVCCVGGELHALGTRMVSDLLTIDGWDTYACGANTPHEAIRQAVAHRRADVVAISVTMGCHVHLVQEVIAQLRSDAALSALHIMVGGRPFNVDQTLWNKIGANGAATDACGAVALADEWFPRRSCVADPR